MVAGLPEAWRRAFLAASSAMWVVSSLAGPVYAATISSGWGWRWALVAYVPVLVAARLVMARQIQGLRVSGGDNDDSDNGGNGRNDGNDAPLIAALAMACGVALIGLAPAASPWFWPASGLGLVSAVWACSRVFPAGVLRLAPGRRAALATLTWVCASYFALDFLISPAGHDVLVLGPGAVGWALTAAGVLWSAAAMWCGAHPARKGHVYLVRTGLGGLLFAVGGGILAAALLGAVPWWGLHLGWGLSGLGMGLTHQDTLIRCVTDPVELGQRNDGISQAQAATAVTVAANIGGATLGTLVTTLIAPTSAGVEEHLVVPVVVVITIMLSGTPLLARRAA